MGCVFGLEGDYDVIVDIGWIVVKGFGEVDVIFLVGIGLGNEIFVFYYLADVEFSIKFVVEGSGFGYVIGVEGYIFNYYFFFV